jgi:hypothetical protein
VFGDIIYICIYCRVLPGNAKNNLLWVLNLITIYLDFKSDNQSYSLHKFTSYKLHCRTFCPASSSVSTELVCRYLFFNCFLTVLSSVSHLLKRNLCWPVREHLLEVFSLSVHGNDSADSQRLFVATGIIICLYCYNGNASVRCLGNSMPIYALLCERFSVVSWTPLAA